MREEMRMKKIKNRYVIIFLYSMAMMTYYLPYLSTTFYVPFMEAFHLTNQQIGMLMSAYAIVAIPAYFFGGMVADKFSAKLLIVLSCILTGLLGVTMMLVSSYSVLLIYYLSFGFTATFLNWSAFCKLIRTLGTEAEQGKLFGMMEMSYAIVGAIISYGILAALGTILDTIGFKFTALIYGTLLILVGIAIWILCEDNSRDIQANDFNFRMVGAALKHPVVWMNAFIVLGVYITTTGSAYFSPYLSEVLMVPAMTAIGVQIYDSTLSKIIFAPVGGMIRDKIGKTAPLLIVVCTAVIAILLVIRFAVGANTIPLIAIAIVVLFISVNSLLRSSLYTPIPEGGVPIAVTGTATGIVSAIGYSSDLWLYTLCGSWIDKYGVDGYNRIWMLLIFGMVIVVVAAIFFGRYMKTHKAEIEAVYAENERIAAEAEAAETAGNLHVSGGECIEK